MRCEPTSVRLMRDRLEERSGGGCRQTQSERWRGNMWSKTQKHIFLDNSSCNVGATSMVHLITHLGEKNYASTLSEQTIFARCTWYKYESLIAPPPTLPAGFFSRLYF